MSTSSNGGSSNNYRRKSNKKYIIKNKEDEDEGEVDYYPELIQHCKFIEKHPECECEYGLLCDDTLYLFKTHHDFFHFEKCNNIIINNYKFYIMEEVKDNIKPDDY